MKDIKELEKFLLFQHLGYPGYDDWVERSTGEIESGYKKTILAFSDDHLVGDLIYQQHKHIPSIREIKNL